VGTSFAYDALNRVISKSYTNDPNNTPSSCFQYDTPISTASDSFPIGHLALEWTQIGGCPSASTVQGTVPAASLTGRAFLSHDSRGRVWTEEQCTPSGCRSLAACTTANGNKSYSYDLAGNLTCYGNGIPATPGPSAGFLFFTQQFDAAGRLQAASSNWNDATHPATLFSTTAASVLPCTNSLAPAYAAFGGLMNATLGTGLTFNRAYDNRLRTNCEIDTGSIVPVPTSGSATVTITGSEQNK
jgi:hypothetical protein